MWRRQKIGGPVGRRGFSYDAFDAAEKRDSDHFVDAAEPPPPLRQRGRWPGWLRRLGRAFRRRGQQPAQPRIDKRLIGGPLDDVTRRDGMGAVVALPAAVEIGETQTAARLAVPPPPPLETVADKRDFFRAAATQQAVQTGPSRQPGKLVDRPGDNPFIDGTFK